MKQTLLLFVFSLLTTIGFAQQSGPYSGSNDYEYAYTSFDATEANTFATNPKTSIQIYPNPAVDFIGVSDDVSVKAVVVYNLVGRKMKNFQAMKGEKYYVADLPDGMYLIQLIGHDNKVITTQRISKRSTP